MMGFPCLHSVLRLERVGKIYPTGEVLRDVTWEVKPGDRIGLVGVNGAGKSTFVGMVSGRIEATMGQVMFDGKDVSHLPAHKRIQLGIAYTFQITSVFSGLSVYENVALAVRRTFDGEPSAFKEKVHAALVRVGLDDRARQIAGDLSYGHQRLLEIAMGLAQDPKLFILDEPTQGLAESEIANFIRLIISLAGETTILLIEHNMKVVMEAADFITVLDQGQILATGTPAQISNNSAVQAAYLGKSDA